MNPKFLAAAIAIALMMPPSFGQTAEQQRGPHKDAGSRQTEPASRLPFKVFDYRGEGVPTALALAGGASKKAYIVLLVGGSDPALIKNAEQAVLEVFRSGRERVVLIIGDGDSKLWSVSADGLPYSSLDEAEAVPRTKAATVETMIEAYDKYVVPKINAVLQQNPSKN